MSMLKNRPAKLFLIFFIMSVLCCPFILTAKEHKKVRIVGVNYNMALTPEKKQRPISGYAFEYISKIAAYAGWDVEYILTDHFTSCMQKMKNGEADVFYDVSYTPEREKFLLFPNLSMGEEQYALFVKRGTTEIDVNNPQSLFGKKIGVSAETLQLELLKKWKKKNNVDFEIIPYTSYSKKTEDLLSGKLDLDCDVRMREESEYSLLAIIGKADYYLVAGINRPDILQDINAAQRKLQSSDPFFMTRITEKYFYEGKMAKNLSQDEVAWIKKHDIVKVGCVEDYFPFSYRDEKSGKLAGLVFDLTPLFLKKLDLGNVAIKYSFYPTMTELLHALHKGNVDVMFPYYIGSLPDFDHNVITSREILDGSMSAVFKRTADFQKSLDKIAVAKYGFGRFFIRENFPESEILLYDSIEECIDSVKNGIASCLISYTDVLNDKVWGDEQLQIRELYNKCYLAYAACQDNIGLISIINRAKSLTEYSEIMALDRNYNLSKQQTFLSVLKSYRVHFAFIGCCILLFLVLALIQLAIAHKRLINTKKELEIQQIRLEEALEKSKVASKAKTAFLFNMSHDIRTPMNAIIGFCNMAFNNMGNLELLKNCLTKLRKSGEFLTLVLNDVLAMSNIEHGNIKLSLSKVNIAQIFDTLDPLFRILAEQKKIQLSFTTENIKNDNVYMDQFRVVKILTNLVNNAISFNREGGWVKVGLLQTEELRQGNPVYSFTVEDNGIGISEEFQGHIFEAFAREKNTTQTGIPGTGIGLTLCKELVDLMGGTILCQSTKDVGTLFTVKIPFRVAEEEKKLTKHDDSIDYSAMITGKKCLIVEDNELNSEILADILEEAGASSETAENGKIAVETVRHYDPEYFDCILMDIQMPVMDGYEATQAIRAMYPECHIPIIAVSANAFEEDIKKSLASGMNAHVAKPVDPKLLFRTMAQYLR